MIKKRIGGENFDQMHAEALKALDDRRKEHRSKKAQTVRPKLN